MSENSTSFQEVETEKPKEIILSYEDVELVRDGNTILSGINLNVYKGDFIYLIGNVGSGKSTFIKSVYHDIPIHKGEARVMDFQLDRLSRKQIPYLRRRVGVVFQDFQLLTDRSAIKNLEFVLRATGWKNSAQIEIRIEEVLKQVGMENKGYKMPHELSGGEQQRIVIARSLLNSPEIILADEPTGNLDPQTGFQIIELLQKISNTGTAVIISTHNYKLIDEYPGRIYKCDNGGITEVKIKRN